MLGVLARLGDRLPQVLDQLLDVVAAEYVAGTLQVVNGAHGDAPASVVTDVARQLCWAATSAHALSTALERGEEVTLAWAATTRRVRAARVRRGRPGTSRRRGALPARACHPCPYRRSGLARSPEVLPAADSALAHADALALPVHQVLPAATSTLAHGRRDSCPRPPELLPTAAGTLAHARSVLLASAAVLPAADSPLARRAPMKLVIPQSRGIERRRWPSGGTWSSASRRRAALQTASCGRRPTPLEPGLAPSGVGGARASPGVQAAHRPRGLPGERHCTAGGAPRASGCGKPGGNGPSHPMS